MKVDPKGLVRKFEDVDRTHPLSGPGWERRRSDACATVCVGESMTEQSHKDSCDINILMSRYEKNGTLPRSADGQPFFGDFSEVGDFQAAQNMVIEASDAFMQLPAKVRSRFGNDPGQLLDFLAEPENRAEAIRLGLMEPAKAPPSAPAVLAAPAAPIVEPPK